MNDLKLEATCTFDFVTLNPATGAASDADVTPTAEIFEETTDMTVEALTVTKRSGQTGLYRVTITAAAAHGYEIGKSYNLVVSATVNTIAGKAVIGQFVVRARSSDDLAYSTSGTPPVVDPDSGIIRSTGTTAADLITRALRLLGVVGATDTPDAESLAIGKVALDDFVDGLGAQRAAISAVARTVYPLTSGVAAYTIGPGGLFNQARPVWIDRVSISPSRMASPVLEIPIGRPMTTEDYQAIPVKTTTGLYPTTTYYDHGWVSGLGTITVYPVPDNSGCDLVLYAPGAPGMFADLTTAYILPTGWSRMYRYNLARELADDFDKVVTPNVDRIATEALAIVKRANARPTDARLDAGMPGLRGGGRFSLYTGGSGGTS